VRIWCEEEVEDLLSNKETEILDRRFPETSNKKRSNSMGQLIIRSCQVSEASALTVSSWIAYPCFATYYILSQGSFT